jgi:hypothetical protein
MGAQWVQDDVARCLSVALCGCTYLAVFCSSSQPYMCLIHRHRHTTIQGKRLPCPMKCIGARAAAARPAAEITLCLVDMLTRSAPPHHPRRSSPSQMSATRPTAAAVTSSASTSSQVDTCPAWGPWWRRHAAHRWVPVAHWQVLDWVLCNPSVCGTLAGIALGSSKASVVMRHDMSDGIPPGQVSRQAHDACGSRCTLPAIRIRDLKFCLFEAGATYAYPHACPGDASDGRSSGQVCG